MKQGIWGLSLVLAMCLAAPVLAGDKSTVTVTPDVTEIYSTEVFGSEKLTVDWKPSVSVRVDQSLLSIDSASELAQLFKTKPSPSPVISVYFVKAINYCAGRTGTFQGCASGTSIAVVEPVNDDSDPLGAVSHELGHVLGLDHVPRDDDNNLMSDPQRGKYGLTADQVQRILRSPLLANGHTVTLLPIAITSVPEPETALMFLAGLGLIGWRTRRAPAS